MESTGYQPNVYILLDINEFACPYILLLDNYPHIRSAGEDLTTDLTRLYSSNNIHLNSSKYAIDK